MPPRRRGRSTGPSAMLAEEAKKDREEHIERKASEPLLEKRKPSVSTRLPPVPKRTGRDLAAARRQTTLGDGAPSPATAPGSGPAGLPRPITAAASTRTSTPTPTPPSKTAPPIPPVKTATPPPAEEPPDDAVEASAEPAAAATASPTPRSDEAPSGDPDSKAAEPDVTAKLPTEERVDPSEPQLLAPHEPTTSTPPPTSTDDEWPDPEASNGSVEREPSAEWKSPDDTFTTPKTRTQLGVSKSRSPNVDPVPEVPDGGLWPQVRYMVHFVKGRWQRRGAIKVLKEQITSDTSALDAVLGQLGADVRKLELDNRGLSAENAAIDEAEERKAVADREFSELQNRQAEENNRFAEIESDRQSKVDEAEEALEAAKQELGSLEAQRRGLRDKRKALTRRQEGLVKAAEDRESKASKQPMGDDRAAMRRSAEDLRREAAGLDPDRQDLDRRLSALEKPISIASSKVEALKAELESAKRSLNDGREGHRHKQAEIDAEKGKKSRELAQADAEIKRRLVTLGTLVNLNRIDRDEFVEIYSEIDVLRGAIGSRTTEIDRLSVERDAYDKQALTRGALILAGGFLLLCLLIALLIWAI